MKKLLATMMMLAVVMGIHAQQTISAQEMSDRIQIRALVENYALLSDQFKQENYNEVFHKDLKLRTHMGENVNEINGVDNMINIYKAAGAVDISFHQNRTTGTRLYRQHPCQWMGLPDSPNGKSR